MNEQHYTEHDIQVKMISINLCKTRNAAKIPLCFMFNSILKYRMQNILHVCIINYLSMHSIPRINDGVRIKVVPTGKSRVEPFTYG